MESYEKENLSPNFEENKKKYKMALLYIQSIEAKRLIISQNFSQKKYFLVNKEWLDEFRKINNYNYAVQMLNSFNDWDNYSNFHQKISKFFSIKEAKNNINDINDGFEKNINIVFNKERINDYLNYPKNFEIVNEEFFRNCICASSGFPLFDVWIGNNLVIINDSENHNIIFVCNLVENEDNRYNSLVQVNYILVFENGNYTKNELYQILSLKNINNYFNQRKIDFNRIGQQNIIDQNGNKYGIFFSINDMEYKQINEFNNNINQGNNYQNIINVPKNNNIPNLNQNGTNSQILRSKNMNRYNLNCNDFNNMNQSPNTNNNNINEINSNEIHNRNMDLNNRMNVEDMNERNNGNQVCNYIYTNTNNSSNQTSNNQSQTNFNNFYNPQYINNDFNNMSPNFSIFNNTNNTNNPINFEHLQNLSCNDITNYINYNRYNNLANNNLNYLNNNQMNYNMNNHMDNNMNNHMNNNNMYNNMNNNNMNYNMNNNMNNNMYNNNMYNNMNNNMNYNMSNRMNNNMNNNMNNQFDNNFGNQSDNNFHRSNNYMNFKMNN